jgi:putative transposase
LIGGDGTLTCSAIGQRRMITGTTGAVLRGAASAGGSSGVEPRSHRERYLAAMRGIAFACVGSIHDKLMPTLRRLVSERGAPRYLRSDNGPEFVARALLEWIVDQGIETALIDPGKPWQNGVSESFNGKFRDECLSMEWFLSRAQAKAIIEAWRRHYNEVRPHSSLGYLTPAEFAASLQQTNAAPASATGRDATRHGGFAPRPVATPSLKGQSSEQEMPVLST